ncbi:flagellar hook-associated protein FlgK [Ammoniphilus sp. 3BR4]|uniref:flagellar hook-associated protein FlgK n=1 Tax=Ammoniphilus sp. 3BR4 TaxID=3158265 RepID=UPI0034675FE7
MASTFGGLEVGKRALYAQQAAMSTTGHNIANANTEGFSRQRAVLKTTDPYPHPGMNNGMMPGQIGTGVEVTTIERMREAYLDRQYRSENSHHGYWDTRQTSLEQLEGVFNELSEHGLHASMDKFWQSWQDLMNEPESLSAREIVMQRGVAVVDSFRHLSGSIQAIKEDLTTVRQEKTDQANQLAEELRKVNEDISRLVPHGYTPNDLYDRRDQIIDQLSKFVDVTVTPSTQGMVNVVAAGQPLVTGRDPITPLTVDSPVQRGELLALREMVGTPGEIDSYLQKLNQLATVLTTEVNRLHSAGYDLNGNQSGLVLFIGNDATTIQMNPELLLSPSRLAAAGSPVVGNSDRARAIAALKFTELPGLGSAVTMDQFFSSMISKIGVDTEQAKRFVENSELTKEAIETRRQSVSGVSLDEEMSNMIKFQHAYNAAARSITVVDEMLDKLINGTGVVGR